MFGQMMDRPLLLSAILRHAELQHPNREIVSITADQPRHRYTFREAFARSRKLANALQRMNLQQGDRIATLAWNDFRHFEIYYGVSCSGFVCHTINPRLFEDQIAYIVNHAEDRWLFLDPAFVPLIEKLQARLPKLEGYVILTDDAHMPATSLRHARSYESLIAPESERFEWPEFDERTASSLCYTSGTTGDPKGVLYSHRSTLLHTYAAALPDALQCSAKDVILPVVPMFHVNAWGLPYAACMTGSKLVFPGPGLDGKSLYELFESERVTMSAGVPTVWQGLLTYVEANGLRFSTMRRTVIGGSACPPAMMATFQERYDVQVLHAWGMTEMSPVGTVAALKGSQVDLDAPTRFAIQAKQGRAVYGVDMKIVGDDGN